MASERLNVVVYLTVMVIAAAIQMQSTDAQNKIHTLDWIIPTDSNFYSTYAASNNFTVGDTLVFNFTTGAHTAAQVTKEAYDACTTANFIALWKNGPSSVTLNTSGLHYYLCTFPSHCSNGQKVSITVAAAATTPPSTTPSEAPPAPGTPTTPSAQAPGESTTILLFTFLSVAIMALFY